MRVLGLILVAMAAAAQTLAAPPAPGEDEVRLLEYVLDDVVLSDAVAGYAGPGDGTLLPLAASSELLGVAITVDAERGTARGFVLNEKRLFQLDVARGTVTVGGKARPFKRELVRALGDDIYVDSTLLSEWLPVAFDVELFALRVRIRPRERLPMQARLERERRIRHWRLRLAPQDGAYVPVATAYRLYDMPSIDQTVRLSLAGEGVHGTYATYATGDLLYMEQEVFLAGDDRNPFDDWRLTLRRRDPSGAIGGLLHATELAAGHVYHPASTLLTASTKAAPGFLLTNLPLQRPTEFDRHSFRGNLPPGWDVELYHNGTLVDYRQAKADGQYEFEGVPMLFGMNVFRLIFYGPQGQRREEEHRFLLGDSLTKAGQLEYRLAANAPSADEHRASLALSYGISRYFTATAELAKLPAPDGNRRYAKAGARVFRGALFAYGDYVVDNTGGSAYEAGLQTRVAGMNLLASRTSVRDGYVSEALASIGDPVVARDRLRVDAAIPASFLPRLPLSVEAERQQLESGVTRTIVQGRVSTNWKGLSLSNRLMRTAATGQAAQTEAGLQFSRHVRRVGVRGEVLYGFGPARLTSANLTLERPIGAGYRLYAHVSRSFLDAGHIFSLGVDKSSGSFAAGAETRFTGDGGSTANINLSAGIGRDPRLGAWMASARSRAGFGSLSVRVFLDRNRNSVFDAEDQPLEGVAFSVNTEERGERTGRDGMALLADLSPHAPADLAVVAHSLEDPQWDPAVAGVRVLPRPGKSATIDIPVIATTEIEGTVTRLQASGSQKPVAAAAILLVDASGNVVQRTKSSYDGYYVISKVRPGRYVLQVGDTPGSTREIDVRPDQTLIAGLDFRLGTRGSATAPAVAAVAAEARAVRGRFVVQLGAFTVRANADALLRRIGERRARIDQRGKLFFVETGPYATEAEAAAARAELAGVGFAGIVRPASRS
jgi:cell division septation protein DedD